jgi:pimeloyl-ACP methyl ester carboxylesterase
VVAVEFPPPSRVALGAFRMAYREWGSPAAPPLVLVRGITGSSLSWARVAPLLARRFRVIAVDLKGHGDSDRGDDYAFADQAREVAELCRALGLARVALVGHSWGGAVAVRLATSTSLVERLVLEDPALGLTGMPADDLAAVRKRCAASVGLSPAAAREHTRAEAAHGWTDLDIAGKVDALLKANPAAVRAVFIENDPWDLHPLLSQLTCRTPAAVRAAPARRHRRPSGQRSAQANPHWRVVTIAGADHDIHRTRFEAFMAELEAFLAPRSSPPARTASTRLAHPRREDRQHA